MILTSKTVAVIFFTTLIALLGKAHATFKQSIEVRTSSYFTYVLDESEARYCLAKYNREVERSKDLIAKSGSMTEFFYAQRTLRRTYWELDPNRMVYDQKYIDLWEAYDIGQIDHKSAVAITIKIMNEGYDGRYEKMKSCRSETNKPSWCIKASSAIENAICSDPDLYNLENAYLTEYKRAVAANKTSADIVAKSNYNRKMSCGIEKNCLVNSYITAIKALKEIRSY